MFFFQSKLKSTNNIYINFWTLPTYGLYRIKKIEQIFSFLKNSKKGFIQKKKLIYLKYFFRKIFYNSELNSSVSEVQTQINKSIQSYWGLRISLNLPANGQRTRTNASTQWLLSNTPRKWHFTQKKNWRKYAFNTQKKK